MPAGHLRLVSMTASARCSPRGTTQQAKASKDLQARALRARAKGSARSPSRVPARPQDSLQGATVGGGLRQQIACFELPRFMEKPVLDPPPDVLEVQNSCLMSRVSVEPTQELHSNCHTFCAPDDADELLDPPQDALEVVQLLADVVQQNQLNSQQLCSNPFEMLMATEPARFEPVPVTQLPVPSSLLEYREHMQLPQEIFGCSQLPQEIFGSCQAPWEVSSPCLQPSSQPSSSEPTPVLSYVLPPMTSAFDMLEASPILSSRTPVAVQKLTCSPELVSVSRSSTRSSFGGVPAPCRAVQVQAELAVSVEQPSMTPQVAPVLLERPVGYMQAQAGPQRDSRASSKQSSRATSKEVPSVPSTAPQSPAAVTCSPPTELSAYATPCVPTTARAPLAVPASVSHSLAGSLVMTIGQSPLSTAGSVTMPNIAQSPLSERRTIQLVENCHSFLPSPAVTSPVASWRQVPQQQLRPVSTNLGRSKSVEAPASLIRPPCRGSGSYNLPASLNVEPAQWLRPRSPSASGLRWVGAASPPRSSGAVCTPPCKPQVSSALRGKFVEELLFSGSPFDPTVPAVRSTIFEKLNAAKNATIVQMRQEGGLNEGLWTLAGASGSLLLKLVPHQRRHPMMPSEAEQFVRLAREHPSMIDDPALAFPLKIFACREHGREKASFDLVVMRKAPGRAFADVIGRRWCCHQKQELMRELYAMGSFLADVHARHGMQHGDLTASNVFYDEATGAFTMVDVSDFGPQLWDPMESDAERFCRGVQMLSKCYGDELYLAGRPQFEAGYRERMAIKT